MKRYKSQFGLVVFAFVAWFGPISIDAQGPSVANNEAGRGATGERGVVVMPFANVSGDSTDEWIGAGIAETVAADLSQIGMVAVVGVATTDPVDEGLGLTDDARARQLAEEQGLAWVVTGGFQRVGQRLRVVARVIDVASGSIRQTVTLDGTSEELFELQDAIVVALREGLENPNNRPTQGRSVAGLEASGTRLPPAVTNRDADNVPPSGRTIPAPPVGRSTEAVSSPVTGVSGAGFLGTGAPSDVTVAGAEFGILAGRPLVRPTRVETRPDIDGQIDDEMWRSVASITDFIQESPLDGAPATERTEVRVAYDDENLYLAFHVHYTDRGVMRANRVDRDQANEDDLITVYIDTFLDQQQAFVFDVNGYGVQGDGIINTSGGGRGGGRGRRGGGGGATGSAIPVPDRSWDALFETGARIVEDGYTAEIAIPFKSLRYPQLDADTPHQWGLQIARAIRGKDQEADVWSPMSRDESGFMTQMGVLQGMTGLSTSRNLEFLPTFTGIQFGSLNRASGAFPEDFNGEGGLDVKYGITSNLTVNFTFNPDFSQIESDRAQIDVNQRFPLFYPELRPFFLEGQDIFRLSSPVQWVNTRTIVDPRFGAKLTGKVGNLAIGLLAADDEAPGNVADHSDPKFGQTAKVLISRVRYDLYAQSYMGGLVTERRFMDGYSRASGIDGQFRIGQSARFNYMAFQTQNRDLDGRETSGPSWGLFLQRNGRNLSINSFAGSNHPDAVTDVGFLRRNNTQDFWNTASYRWWPESWIINWGPRVRYQRGYNYNWILEDELINTGLDFSFARNITAGVGFERALERFGGIDFWKSRYTANANVATSRRISIGSNLSWGDQVYFAANPFLGQGVEAGVNIFFRPVARLQSQINVDSSRLRDIRDGGLEIFDIKLFRALTTYQFTERLLLRNITEFNTFADTVGVNFLATYRINAGTVFFVGYDDRYQQFDQFEQMGDELLLRRDLQRTNRAIFTKLQYLFRF